jgi:heat shock protein HslJ
MAVDPEQAPLDPDHPEPGNPDPEDLDPAYSPATQSQKMGLTFFGALALIGILVFLIVFVNAPGIRASAGVLLVKHTWTLQSYVDADGILIPANTVSPVTAGFSNDGSVLGSAGCNDYVANYTTRNLAITISQPVMTRKTCENRSVMQQESAYAGDLAKAVEFRVSESNLNLYDSTGRAVLVYFATG